MHKTTSKVIPLHSAEKNEGKRVAAADNSTMRQIASSILCGYLDNAMQGHIKHAQEELLKTSTGADLEAVSIDMKVFNKVSAGMVSSFVSEVKESFSGVLKKNPVSSVAPDNLDDEFTGFQLLETDEIEDQLVIDGSVYRCEMEFKDVLYALNQRLAVVLGRDTLVMRENPIAPTYLLGVYAQQVRNQLFSKNTQHLLFKSFEEKVLLGLGETYQEIDKLCLQAGIIPKLVRPKLVNTEGSSSVEKNMDQMVSSADQLKEPLNYQQPITNADIPPALYTPLLEMAQAYRSTAGVSDGLIVAGEQLQSHDLFESLTQLQKTAVTEGVNTVDALRSQIGMKIQVGGERRPYTEQDDTLIDVVAMLFDAILQDKQLPDVVRAMIAQLQIPILKVVMIDKEFFAKKNHPARQFLNGLSKAGLGVNEKNKAIRNVVFEKMEILVARALQDFEDDVQLFADLFDELNAFMEQQQRQMDVIEERSRKVTKSGEQMELTKRQAAYEIALRLKGTTIPQFVKTFLDEVWHDVLVLSLLRRDKEPEALKQSLNVIERLVRSVKTNQDGSENQVVLEDLPRLLKDMKVGLENISYDFHQATPWFKELESWHRQVLALKSDVKDAEIPIVEEIILVDTDIDICGVSLEEDLKLEVEGELSQMPQDKYTKRVNKLAVGDWIAYTSEMGEPLRAKLSWKSSVTSKCLFVDEHGAKAMDVSVVELAEQMRQKNISLVGQESAPLVERAFSGMKKLIGLDESAVGFA